MGKLFSYFLSASDSHRIAGRTTRRLKFEYEIPTAMKQRSGLVALAKTPRIERETSGRESVSAVLEQHGG